MRRILIHFDTDPVPSVFDRVVAIDAGVDELLSYGEITPENVESLVHGAIFTRGPTDLKQTAIFIGGSRIDEGQRLFEKVRRVFFGPMRVSVMMDSNGSNTTAAAAVLAAKKHADLKGRTALVLGGTGPVGQRAAELLAREGASVRVASRSLERANSAVATIRASITGAAVPKIAVSGVSSGSASDVEQACRDVEILIAAGAAGAQFLSNDQREGMAGLKVAIDLNAVPPVGLAGIEVTDKATPRHAAFCYGAIGVGGTKMKIHKACIGRLFESNDQVLDTERIYQIGETLALSK